MKTPGGSGQLFSRQHDCMTGPRYSPISTSSTDQARKAQRPSPCLALQPQLWTGADTHMLCLESERRSGSKSAKETRTALMEGKNIPSLTPSSFLNLSSGTRGFDRLTHIKGPVAAALCLKARAPSQAVFRGRRHNR